MSASEIEAVSSLGMEVELARVDREAKQLWKADDKVSTRASLMNLVVISQGADSLASNTGLIAGITQDHACRAILIAIEPGGENVQVRAWISAHCHIGRAGGKQVCCEQIAFLMEGPSDRVLPNVIFGNVDSDLPLAVWWQDEFPAVFDRQLWRWVNRVIYDSHVWKHPAREFAKASQLRESTSKRTVLCDLNWTRQVYIRLAVAHFFDHAEAAASLRDLDTVTVTHAPGYELSALLFVGWMASQLGWEPLFREGESVLFLNRKRGAIVRISLFEKEGSFISKIEGRAKEAGFAVCSAAGRGHLQTTLDLPGKHCVTQVMPAGKGDLASLVSEELARGGEHRIYARTIQLIAPLLAS